MNTKKTNRNAPCPCGSGKKYKQCCQLTESTNSFASHNRLLESIPNLFKEAIKAQQDNDIAQAQFLYQKILDINPKHVDTLGNLGLLLIKIDPASAKALLSKAARLEPSAKNYSNLSIALSNEEAIDCLKNAISLNPGDAVYYKNMGSRLSQMQHHEDAILYFRKALSLVPNYTEALSNIGFSLMQQSQFKEAVIYFKKAIALNPKEKLSYERLLFCLCFDKEAFPHTYLEYAKSIDKLWQENCTPYKQWNTPDCGAENTPLRVGLVSNDFGNHPVGYFLEGLLSHINKSKLEFIAYSMRPSYLDDELTKRIQPHFNEWTCISTLTHQQAAQKIHNDGIHILIDLAGHTANSGLPIFSWRPAPIQVSWLGYFASTGLSFIDYFMSDLIGIPQDKQSYFSEKIWYLPETRLCFTPPSEQEAPPVNNLPALENNFATFGCFQSLSKINDATILLWSQILNSCPNSKLMFKNRQMNDQLTKNNFLSKLEKLGIKQQQLLMEEQTNREEYFYSYYKVDFMLDTFPYPGGTTTCEALWMGVPTLTMTGTTLLERQGHSILSNSGLNNWVCFNESEYVTKAISFAHDTKYLQKLRRELRAQVKASPIMDAVRFSKNFEEALIGMWLQHNK